MWKTEDLFVFYFLRSHQIPEKRRGFSLKTFFFFFFGDQIKIRTELCYFPRLFWYSQNRRSVTFELAPGPRSALGSPACAHVCRYMMVHLKIEFMNETDETELCFMITCYDIRCYLAFMVM